MRVLITTGPTQEPIDDIRFITNLSSGKMGVALAEEAMQRGYDVTLVHGPVSIPLPNCHRIAVKTAKEMIDAVLSELRGGYDVLISAAAIADFTIKKREGKIKSGSKLILELEPTPKLLDVVRKTFPNLFIVGFKAECGISESELIEVAKNKLFYGKLNLVVANDVSKDVFGSDENEVWIVNKNDVRHVKRQPKTRIAHEVWNEIEGLRL
jgi:phosphopantothenoylcysteine decarboxylase/phosphopantothenate--cysteine ligase